MNIKTLLKGLFIFLSLWQYQALAESLSAVVDRTEININETLTLRVRFDGGQAQSTPDFSSLLGQFDILSNQQSSQHSIVNGKVSVFTEWTMMLAAKNPGQILIPPFQMQGQTSNPITINVTRAPTNPNGSAAPDNVFVEVSTDKNEAYVNEQILFTYTLYYNQSIDSLDKPALEIPNARIEELKRVDYQKTINNQRYGVAEYRYVVIPDTTKNIDIPAQTWTVRTTDMPNAGRFTLGRGQLKLYRVKTKDLSITVKPKPADFPANSAWLPANDVTITERWSRSPTELKVGEPITWTITINADGATSEQLPPILAGLVPQGFKIYPDQPSHETQLTAAGIMGTRTESVAIVPNQAGELTLPAIELSWWDTKNNKLKVAKLPAKTVFVTGAPEVNGAQPPSTVANTSAAAPSGLQSNPSPNQNQAEFIYQIPSYIFALLGLLVLTNLGLAAWVWQLKLTALQSNKGASESPTNASAKKAIKHIAIMCDKSDAAGLRSALLAWARIQWPDRPISLQTIMNAANDKLFTEALEGLERSIYSNTQTSIKFDTIKTGVKLMQNNLQSPVAKPTLQPLYAA